KSAGVCVVDALNRDAGGGEVHEHARVHRPEVLRPVQGRAAAHHAATRVAAPDRRPSVAPDIAFEPIGTLHDGRAQDRLAVFGVLRVGPERAVAAANGAVAVEHPARRGLDGQANGTAMTSSPDHPFPPEPVMTLSHSMTTRTGASA